MAFEPRIVRPDDFSQPDEMAADSRASGARASQGQAREAAAQGAASWQAEDHWLPDELQELANQLSADAMRLTDRYPATMSGAAVDGAQPSGKGWRRGLRAAAAAVLVGAGLWLVGREDPATIRPMKLAASATETATSQPDAGPIQIESAPRSPADSKIPALQTPRPDFATQANVRVVDRNPLQPRHGSAVQVAELSVGGDAAPPRLPRDELSMLQAQLQAFERVIVKLQAEVRRRDQLLEETTDMVKTLTAEVETLRKQQNAGK